VNGEGGVFERLRKVPVAMLCDVLAAMRLPYQVVASSLRPHGVDRVIAGPALCLAGREGVEPPAPPGASRPVFEMDRHVTDGCIVVIAAQGHRVGATIDGNVALAWKLRGCTGVVIDGGVRDVSRFAEFALPVFASFVTPVSTKRLWYFYGIDVPITLPGQNGARVRVQPGDAIHADADGVIVIPAAHLEQAVRDAEIFAAMEQAIERDLRTGEDREAVYARYDKVGHIKSIRDAK